MLPSSCANTKCRAFACAFEPSAHLPPPQHLSREGSSVSCLHGKAPGFPGSSQFVMLEANLCYLINIKSHIFKFMTFLVTILAVVYTHTYMDHGCGHSVSREPFYIKSVWFVLKAQHWMQGPWEHLSASSKTTKKFCCSA